MADPISMHNCVIQVDDSGGTPVTISAHSNSVRIGYQKNVAAHHNFGSVWNGATEGGITTNISIGIYESVGATEAHALLLEWMESGGARTVTIQTPNGSAGSRQYQGEALLGGVDPAHESTAGSGDAVKPQATLLGIGDWSPTIIA